MDIADFKQFSSFAPLHVRSADANELAAAIERYLGDKIPYFDTVKGGPSSMRLFVAEYKPHGFLDLPEDTNTPLTIAEELLLLTEAGEARYEAEVAGRKKGWELSILIIGGATAVVAKAEWV